MERDEYRAHSRQRSMRARRWLARILLCGCCLSAAAQPAAPDASLVQQAQKMADEQRWQDIVDLVQVQPSRSADLDFYYGTALAHLERWPQAQQAFEAGRTLAPHDPRFPVELAGVAFKQKRYPRATHLLRQALKLDPHDSYTNDFLGTVYYLEGNLQAALKYWNRVDKPAIVQVHDDPVPLVSPALLDHAFAFSPAATLRLPQFLDTEARLRGMGIFPQFHFDLQARDDGHFDVQFRSQQLNGFGSSKLEALFLLLRGLPFSSVNPEYDNLHHRAINFTSMYRWDAQKRRIYAQLSGPFQGGAKIRYALTTDLRNEPWAIRNSFTGPAPVLASVNLRTERLSFDLTSYASARWHWSGGGEISHRDFRSIDAGAILTPQLLAKGYELKQNAELGATLWRFPERRFLVDADVSSQAARLWSQHDESFEKLQGALRWHWFPQSQGDDYAMTQQIRAGKTFGQVPFDELFMLGLERDNDLPMRAHIGTRGGRKGSAPLGRNYFLSNWEADKNLYENGIVAVKLGPFLDTGQITDPSSALGSHKWLTDTGLQAKLSVFGRGVVFSYGKDLRSGNNAFYVTILGSADTVR